jgi:hypothetical protein
MILAFFLSLMIVSMVGCGWGLVVNKKTHRQKSAILGVVFRKPYRNDALDLAREYDRVTYGQHFWALFWFRDPFKLYPQSIRDALERAP